MASQRILNNIVTAALLVLLAIACAHWYWIFAAPAGRAPVEPMRADTARPSDAIRRANLFGEPAGAPAATPVRSDLVLRGISASRSGGLAVIALDRGRTVTVRAGDEIASGIRLERVLNDHVIVIQNGVPQRVELPQRRAVDAPPVGGPPGSGARK